MNIVEFLDELYRASVWYSLFLFFLLYFSLLMLTFRALRLLPTPEELERFIKGIPSPIRIVLSFISPRSSNLQQYVEKSLAQPRSITLVLTLVGIVIFAGLMLVMLRQILFGIALAETPTRRIVYVLLICLSLVQFWKAFTFGSRLKS